MHFCQSLQRAFFLALAGIAPLVSAQAEIADAIYSDGEILTMRGQSPEYVESLAVKDGKILAVGRKADVLKLAGPTTRQVDLAGHTLLPGFIDTHGHMVYFGKNLVDADLFGCADIPQVLERMKLQAARVPAGGWIVGFGLGTWLSWGPTAWVPTSVVLGYGAYNGIISVVANIVVAAVLSLVFPAKGGENITDADFLDARKAG